LATEVLGRPTVFPRPLPWPLPFRTYPSFRYHRLMPLQPPLLRFLAFPKTPGHLPTSSLQHPGQPTSPERRLRGVLGPPLKRLSFFVSCSFFRPPRASGGALPYPSPNGRISKRVRLSLTTRLPHGPPPSKWYKNWSTHDPPFVLYCHCVPLAARFGLRKHNPNRLLPFFFAQDDIAVSPPPDGRFWPFF